MDEVELRERRTVLHFWQGAIGLHFLKGIFKEAELSFIVPLTLR